MMYLKVRGDQPEALGLSVSSSSIYSQKNQFIVLSEYSPLWNVTGVSGVSERAWSLGVKDNSAVVMILNKK